jgi:glycerophosphoryl diester phosphodiesterase
MRRRAERPWIYGHRGASARAPENTLRGFALALDEGADGVELDVRDAADGTVVVCHDPSLERLAKSSALVARSSMRALGEIDLGGGERIPTLDAAIDLVRGRDALLNVEVKGDVPDRLHLCRAVSRLLSRRSPRDREGILVSSFRPEMLAAIRFAGPPLPVAFLFDEENTGIFRARVLARALRPDGMHPKYSLALPDRIQRWQARGCFVGAWTVDDPARARALAEAGIDALITNDPRGIAAALSGRGPIG